MVVLDVVKYVHDKSKNVSIDLDSISSFAKTQNWTLIQNLDLLYGLNFRTELEKVSFLFLFSCVNFCFWGDNKWEVNIDGKYVGSTSGIILALKREVDIDSEFVYGDVLANLTPKKWGQIIRGKGELLFTSERLDFLNKYGEILRSKYDNDVINILEEGHFEVEYLIDLLSKTFPFMFNDSTVYKGRKISFYKKAQHLVSYLNNLGNSKISIKGLEKLTAFADYRVPQLLRELGILVYSKELADKIDNNVEIIFGSEEEVEIRANTIWAVELIKREVKNIFGVERSARVIDNFLWMYSKEKCANMKPHHRCRTIFY